MNEKTVVPLLVSRFRRWGPDVVRPKTTPCFPLRRGNFVPAAVGTKMDGERRPWQRGDLGLARSNLHFLPVFSLFFPDFRL